MALDISPSAPNRRETIREICREYSMNQKDAALYADYMLQRGYKFYAHFVPSLEAIWVKTSVNGRTRWIVLFIGPETYTEVGEGKGKIVKETHARDIEPTPDLIDVNPTNSSMEWSIPRRIQELLSLPHSSEDSI